MDGKISVERELIDTIRIKFQTYHGELLDDEDFYLIDTGYVRGTVASITVEEAEEIISQLRAQIEDIPK